MTEERKLWLSICNNDLKKLEACAESIQTEIHHIDGDATNNKEQNLQVLCPNHHAMTEHFGSRNKNSTRKYRYKK